MQCGRNSVGVDIEEAYLKQAKRRVEKEAGNLFTSFDLQFQWEAAQDPSTASSTS